MLPSWVVALAASPLFVGVLGHAGGHSDEEIHTEIRLRNIVAEHSKRAIGKCADSATNQALRERALARRAAAAHAIREQRGLQNEHVLARRDSASLQKWAEISHDQSSENFSIDTPTSTIFASNATCALVPETVIGPYYVDGELIRTDITDGQTGVPVHLDVQFVDLETCAGIPSLLIDIWHCNSTGVYSGVAAEGQGGLKSTHGRGAQQTDDDGVAQFDTLFPGHYTGRATHIHVMSTADATVLPNSTFVGGTSRHIGQLYFDEDLRDQVEQLAPYNTNSQAVTKNTEDMLAPDEATAEYDPFVNYVMLGASLEDGLLMWITIALNTSADYSASVTPAAHYYEGGGVAVDNGGAGGPDGAPGGGPPGAGGPPPGFGNSTASASASAGLPGNGSAVVPSGSSVSSTVLAVTATAGAARGRGIGW